jgi:hypothetical protein
MLLFIDYVAAKQIIAPRSIRSPAFQEGMKRIAATIPNGKARLELLPCPGHVPFMAPELALPPLIAFLKERLTR